MSNRNKTVDRAIESYKNFTVLNVEHLDSYSSIHCIVQELLLDKMMLGSHVPLITVVSFRTDVRVTDDYDLLIVIN